MKSLPPLVLLAIALTAILLGHSLLPLLSQNRLYIQLNQQTARQPSPCQPLLHTPLHQITPIQFSGKGRVITNTVHDLSEPETFFKIYGNDTIETTIPLIAGHYRLELLAKHARPGPVILQLWANQLPVGILTYAQNDNSWESMCLQITPNHFTQNFDALNLALRFSNDGGPNGARDASIGWINLSPLSDRQENQPPASP